AVGPAPSPLGSGPADDPAGLLGLRHDGHALDVAGMPFAAHRHGQLAAGARPPRPGAALGPVDGTGEWIPTGCGGLSRTVVALVSLESRAEVVQARTRVRSCRALGVGL